MLLIKMGKNVFKRLSIGLLTTALALSLLTGCGEIKAGSTVLKVGDEVTVKVYEIDDQGRINLTRKDLYME